MLRFREAELTRTAGIESGMTRLVERSAIPLEIGQAVGLSEAQVSARLAAADRLRSGTPQTWNAFMVGRIDWARAREIAGTVALLELPESLERLDDTVGRYASTHTVAELRAWLKRFVARVEAEQAAARAEAARRQRDVTITHVDDGMAWVNAFVPSHQAAAIDARLRRTTRPEGDDRTRGQFRADTFVDLLLATDDPSPARTRTHPHRHRRRRRRTRARRSRTRTRCGRRQSAHDRAKPDSRAGASASEPRIEREERARPGYHEGHAGPRVRRTVRPRHPGCRDRVPRRRLPDPWLHETRPRLRHRPSRSPPQRSDSR